MFTYCQNSPVVYVDTAGYLFVGLLNGNPETITDFGGGGYSHSVTTPIIPDDPDDVVERVQKDIESVAIGFYEHKDDIAYATTGIQFTIDLLKKYTSMNTAVPSKYAYIMSAILFAWDTIERLFFDS